MRFSIARALRAGIAATLLTAGLGVATAQPAFAACGFSYVPSTNGDGSAIVKSGTWNLKDAYYADCANVGKVYGYDRVWLRCYVVNDYNNTWWYVRRDGTSLKGWISGDNIRIEEDISADYAYC
ncbi:hypothetical protein GCM10010112_84790 [Actinoplanes lobatus]|uniref:SH3 domain-containing protein n=2 Tax=Actinoplanes TaxID=1865 RepID=A0A7W5AQ34_9ACTN|nr:MULTISPECIES: hypothetical protein [Actinoplanes]MBB3100382.1 hypothetical protein [Actinoplanes campanulatus]MBB4752382.1 hypothetical protein [Actinoplanes lobatus]GGN24512.1 hypothetical protein GCM10010109_40080 [Actinoplanes campanulatus]GGN94979.1 hypothetical protein GCM10010112_84790 [Actinoplanes lobatus]GID39580.1 hypothetical protein Aca09nite_60860 [Actinoplanes campanulatus]